jgi:hypothetical protein
VWLLVLSLWAGVVSQGWIYTVIRRFRLRLMDELAAAEGFTLSGDVPADVAALAGGRPGVAERLSVYDVIAAAPGLPFGTATVVQYLAAVAGSVVGFLLPITARR